METFTVKATLSHPEHRGTALTLDLHAADPVQKILVPVTGLLL